MSRILKRPMFRKGGSVSSEDTGITSGLMEPKQKYANGTTDIGVQPSFLENVYYALNPPTSEILKRLQARQKEEPLMTKLNRFLTQPVPETELTYRTEAERQAVIDRLAAEEESKKMLASEKEKLLKSTVGEKPTTQQVLSEQPAKSDLKTVYEDLLPLFKQELGIADDEFSRQKYLELAKFGLNLLRQPAGPIGGKANIFGAAAAAAEKPLEAYGAILAKEKQAERLPRALALEAAMKEVEPGAIAKSVKDLQKLGMSKEEAIRTATQSGTATREQTYEGVVRNIQESLIKDGIVTNANAARGTAEDLLIAEKKYGIKAYQFEPLPKNPVEGSYYIMKNGQSGRFYKGSLIKPGEQGFVGSLTE